MFSWASSSTNKEAKLQDFTPQIKQYRNRLLQLKKNYESAEIEFLNAFFTEQMESLGSKENKTEKEANILNPKINQNKDTQNKDEVKIPLKDTFVPGQYVDAFCYSDSLWYKAIYVSSLHSSYSTHQVLFPDSLQTRTAQVRELATNRQPETKYFKYDSTFELYAKYYIAKHTMKSLQNETRAVITYLLSKCEVGDTIYVNGQPKKITSKHVNLANMMIQFGTDDLYVINRFESCLVDGENFRLCPSFFNTFGFTTIEEDKEMMFLMMETMITK